MYTTTAPDTPVSTPSANATAAVTIAVRASEGEGIAQYVPLRQLRIDELNVCTKEPTEEEINELADLIQAQRLLQNLIVIAYVTPRHGKGKEKRRTFTHGVVAGGRRLRALLWLVKRGVMTLNEEILCTVVPIERALAVSVAENSGRVPMSVADTVQAFAAMVAEGAGIEDMAVAFGVTPLTVRRRLKLATVSPRLFEIFREGDMNLDQLMALALTDDHARQEAAWEGSSVYNRTPRNLRSLIVGEAPSASLVKFVGLKAYEEAGGGVLRDLFGEEGESNFIQDVPLLRSLAMGKLGEIAESLRAEGAGWVEVMLDYDYAAQQRFRHAPVTMRAPTDEEAQNEAEIETKLNELSDQIEALYDGEDDTAGDEQADSEAAEVQALQQQVWDLENARDAAKALRRIVLPEAAGLCGAVVSVGHGGLPAIVRDLVKKEDFKTVERANAKARAEEGRPVGDHAGDSREADESAPSGLSGLSEALCRELTSHCTRALQALLIVNHREALAGLAHALLSTLIYGPSGQYESPTALAVRGSDCDSQLKAWAKDLGQSHADKVVSAYVEQCKAQLPREASELLPWLLSQELETLVHLLALCSALTVNAITGKGGKHAADALAVAVNLDMAEFWSPTGPSYLSRVSKQLIADAVTEAGMADEAPAILKMKKGDAVDKAAALLEGKRWVPSVLR